MKIDTNNNHGIDQKVDADRIKYSDSYHKNTARTAAMMGGISLDISGTVTDDAAYGIGELKSCDEIMQDAGKQNITLQRNYMAVMSNSMSAEDFAKLQEEGYSPADTDIETQVTSLDKIKAKLAEAGTIIAGYNDDLTDEQLAALTGNAALVEQLKTAFKENDVPLNEENIKGVKDALEKSEYIKPLSEDVKKYLVINNLEPNIENLYKAEFSAGNSNGRQSKGYYQDSTAGYYAKKADSYDFSQIKDQIESVIKKSSLDVSETTVNEAEWIIKNGIALTEDTLRTYDRLNNIKLPVSKGDVINLSAVAVANGKNPVKQVIDKTEPNHSMASEVIKKLDRVSAEAIDRVVASGRTVNINNLYDASINEAEYTATSNKVNTEQLVMLRRQLEETRLAMTFDANLRLIKQGISIDTEPIEKLVNELKDAERAYYEPVLLNNNEKSYENKVQILDERISLFKTTEDVFERLRTIPAEVLGRINVYSKDFTPNSLVKQGEALKEVYSKVEKSYEALMTAPRKDLGDSISKAFRNVDEILSDNGYELNEANRKAVRILGYSGNAIDKESISNVRMAEQAVSRVMELMTPKRVLDFIRNGENPIDENIYELERKLENIDEENSTEKYSRFLRKLESKNEINDQEKAAFIGVYRLFRQIEKSDGALIGNVLANNERLTLRNILKASRSNRAKGMDISVNNDFGGLTALNKKSESISEQIDRAYVDSLSRETLDKMDPDSMINSRLSLDDTLEKFADNIISKYDGDEFNKEQADAQKELLKEAKLVSDDVITTVSEYEQPVTVNNLLATNDIIMNRGNAYKSLMEKMKKQGEASEEKIKSKIQNLVDKFVSKESADNAYDELISDSNELLNEGIEDATSYIDVREMSLLHKEMSVLNNFAKQDNYEIPVNINGEWTSINVKLVSDSDMEGTVTVTFDSESYGKVAAGFVLDGKNVKGYITSDNQDAVNILSLKKNALVAEISTDGRKVTELDFVRNNNLNLNDFAKVEKNNKANTEDLYKVAKALIVTLIA